MNVHELILKTRSYRRFHENVPVSASTLRELVEMARIAQSPWNRQAVKFLFCNRPEKNAEIFPLLGWASRMPDWPGPAEGERPAAYILIFGDKEVSKTFNCDHVVAGSAMLLGATERGLGGCLIGAFHKKRLAAVAGLPDRYEPLLVVALGRPNETIVLDPLGPDGTTAYWNDESGIHHVPKRALDELILGEL